MAETSPKMKHHLAEPCTRINKAVFISDNYLHSDKLAKAAHKFPEIWDPNATSVPVSRTLLDAETWNEGCEAFCIVVDWARYDNETIKDEFGRLGAEVIKTRPSGTKPQFCMGSGRGRDTGANSESRIAWSNTIRCKKKTASRQSPQSR